MDRSSPRSTSADRYQLRPRATGVPAPLLEKLPAPARVKAPTEQVEPTPESVTPPPGISMEGSGPFGPQSQEDRTLRAGSPRQDEGDRAVTQGSAQAADPAVTFPSTLGSTVGQEPEVAEMETEMEVSSQTITSNTTASTPSGGVAAAPPDHTSRRRAPPAPTRRRLHTTFHIY